MICINVIFLKKRVGKVAVVVVLVEEGLKKIDWFKKRKKLLTEKRFRVRNK